VSRRKARRSAIRRQQLRDPTILAAVERAVAALPEAERDVLERVYRRGETYQQIAASLGITGEEAKRRAIIAMASVRLALSEQGKTWK
jgi:DNA-directed RNA polymerase specialized sigma24 family protein